MPEQVDGIDITEVTLKLFLHLTIVSVLSAQQARLPVDGDDGATVTAHVSCPLIVPPLSMAVTLTEHVPPALDRSPDRAGIWPQARDPLTSEKAGCAHVAAPELASAVWNWWELHVNV